jgi:hypothetical protein
LLLGMHTMDHNKRSRIESGDKAIALYHVVYAHEGFAEAAQALFTLVQEAQRIHPGKPRKLYLDIEGHRQSAGGFDPAMVELQDEFLLGFLSPYLSEIHAPLVRATTTKPQENELPPALVIQDHRQAKRERVRSPFSTLWYDETDRSGSHRQVGVHGEGEGKAGTTQRRRRRLL